MNFREAITLTKEGTKKAEYMPVDKTMIARHTAQVMYTEEYSKFKYLKGNRPVNARHVQELIASFEARPELIHLRPVLVNEKMEIVDGQHSLVALQTLDLPVPYVMTPGLTIGEAQLLNALQKPWKMEDYARSYATDGKRDYQTIAKLLEEYHIPITVMIQYASAKIYDRSERDFKLGRFKIGEDMEFIKARLDMLSDFADIAPFWNTSSFARAFHRITRTEGYSHARMLSGAKQMKLTRQGSQRDYTLELERAYNHRKQTDVKRFI